MTDRLRILALLMTLMPALLAPVGLRMSLCFCSLAGAEYASGTAAFEDLGPADYPVSGRASVHVSLKDQFSCACCGLDQCRKEAAPSSNDEREDRPHAESGPCTGWLVFEVDAMSIDRTKSETVDLDARLLVRVSFTADALVAPIRAQRLCRAPDLARQIGRTPGGMPLRV